MASRKDLAFLRLAAQGIVDPQGATPADVVRRMGCMQGQDYAGVRQAIALRTQSGDVADVHAAMDRGEIVRSWPLRGTLFALAAEDLPWILETVAVRIVDGAAKRRDGLGIDAPMIDAARELALEALADRKRLPRAELMDLWADAGLLGVKQRGYHLLWTISQLGHVCFGPTRDGEQLVVAIEDWIPTPNAFEGEDAVGELARRYFSSHGPATVKDFVWWTKLPAGEARAGVARAREGLEMIEVDGVEHLMDPATPDRLAAVRKDAAKTFLLPAFDEYTLGYQDRAAQLPAEHADATCPGNNGVFRPIVVDGGQVVGTWKRAGSGKKVRIEAKPFTTLTKRAQRAVAAAA